MKTKDEKYECSACDQREAILIDSIIGKMISYGYEIEVGVETYECKSCGYIWSE